MESDTAVVIANGLKEGETILNIIRGKSLGTFITKNGQSELHTPVEVMADEGMCTRPIAFCSKYMFIFSS